MLSPTNAQPFKVDDSVSIAGISGYIYVQIQNEIPCAFEIRDSSLENVLGRIDIPNLNSQYYTPGYTELFFDSPINVCGKFYLVFNHEVRGREDNLGIYVSSNGSNNPDMYPKREKNGEWNISGVYSDGGGSYMIGDTLKAVFIFPIIADSAYMDNNDTTETEDTVSSLRHVEIDKFTHLFPNPAENVININSSYRIERIEIYDEARIVLKEDHPRSYCYKADLKDYKKGIYFVKIETKQGLTTKKLVKQ